MNQHGPFSLFEVFGVELEYIIVCDDTLSVKPIADRVLFDVAGTYTSEVEFDDIAWSNELALHVIELKTNGPTRDLAGLPEKFHQHTLHLNRLLQKHDARLMPTAMHPWMNPAEMQLWPHEYNTVYEAFNRVFDCRGHGWANLQSVHLNLPFADDAEFGRLHAAIRLLLPILPALAASSPLVDGRITGICDNRLDVYRRNAAKIPSITGQIIPEQAFSRRDYEHMILAPMYRDIAPHDVDGTLQHEWLNARGAIARFDRQAIEIRVLDVQECPVADLAICAAAVGVLQGLCRNVWTTTSHQQAFPTEVLVKILTNVIRDADEAVIDDASYLQLFGAAECPLKARDLWQHLLAQTRQLQPGGAEPWSDPLDLILNEGPLARRIVRRLGQSPEPARLMSLYAELTECLKQGAMMSCRTERAMPCDRSC